MKWKQFFRPATSINSNEAKDLIADEGASNVTLLDVRQPKEYEVSHIPGARLIPMGELDNQMDELDPEKPIVVY